MSKLNLVCFLKASFWRFEWDELTSLLKTKYNVCVVNTVQGVLDRLDQTDCLIVSTEAINILISMHDINPDLLYSIKLIVIRTFDSYDVSHLVETTVYKNNIYLGNVFMTLNGLIFDQHHNITLRTHRKYLTSLNELGNIELMPIFKYSMKPKLTRVEFYTKYGLDQSKGIITFFLAFPKNYIFPTIPLFNQDIETYICNNHAFLDTMVQILQKQYNVVFKCHPIHGMAFNPFVSGKKWGTTCSKRSAVSLSIMKPIIDKYTFINVADGHDLNIFTDMGILPNRSSFGINNYLWNIPLLYISNKNKFLEKQFLFDLQSRFSLDLVCYGEFTTIEELETTPDTILNEFINKFKNKPDFAHKTDNVLYGNTYDYDITIWSEYIDKIMKNKLTDHT